MQENLSETLGSMEVVSQVVSKLPDIFTDIYSKLYSVTKTPETWDQLISSLNFYMESKSNPTDSQGINVNVRLAVADMESIEASFAKSKHYFVEGEEDYV